MAPRWLQLPPGCCNRSQLSEALPMPSARRSAVIAGSAALPLLSAPLLSIPATAADPPYARILNGTFDPDREPWWTSSNTPAAVADGRLCAEIPAGTVNPWDSMIGQD